MLLCAILTIGPTTVVDFVSPFYVYGMKNQDKKFETFALLYSLVVVKHCIFC